MGEWQVSNTRLGKSTRKLGHFHRRSGLINTHFHVAKNVSDETDSVLIADPGGQDIPAEVYNGRPSACASTLGSSIKRAWRDSSSASKVFAFSSAAPMRRYACASVHVTAAAVPMPETTSDTARVTGIVNFEASTRFPCKFVHRDLTCHQPILSND